MKPQKILTCQNKLEKQKKSWRFHSPRLQTILQSYSHHNSMVLAQKQTHRSMEQDREPRNKPTHLWPNDKSMTKKTIIQSGEKTVSSISGAGKTVKE